MPVIYALVARNKTVLVDQQARSGNFPTITRMLLARIGPEDQKMSYVYDTHVFHYVVENNITYLCLTDEAEKRRIAFAFLDDIKERFLATYGSRAQTAIAYAMNGEFGPILQERMQYFSTNPEADKFAAVRGKIDDVKGIMVQNIEKVLARGEKIELLVDKSDALNRSAAKFEKNSNKLKNQMWWRNVKMWLLIAFIVIVVLYIILGFICGFDFGKCGNDKK